MATPGEAVAKLLDPMLEPDAHDLPIEKKWRLIMGNQLLPRDLVEIVVGYWRPCICFYVVDNNPHMHYQTCCQDIGIFDNGNRVCTWCYAWAASAGDLHATSCPWWLPTPCSNPLKCRDLQRHACGQNHGPIYAPSN